MQRFRAIVMTALAFIFGVVPLVIASGAGAGARQSIGTTVFGGMIAATLIGMLLVPPLYVSTFRTQERVRGLFRRGAARNVDAREE